MKESNWLKKSEKLRFKNLVSPLVAASQTLISVAKQYRGMLLGWHSITANIHINT
uniref:Uncharacterized protein n=1 Tax=Tetranychus urticae TaxID=32264 RepID=T1JZT3_TETUR